MVQAKERLLELVIERAYRDGVDIVLASGKRSTFYIDGKKVTLHPEGLYLLANLLLDMLDEHPGVTAVGGLTLGADPMAAAMAALSFPRGRPLKAFLVRKEAKAHGTSSLIEGELTPGEQVAILEDTITTGASAMKAIDAVRAAGCDPVVVLALADRQDPDAQAFREQHRVRSIYTLADLVRAKR